jgi:membrane fusion protein (multidrug efflux system)
MIQRFVIVFLLLAVLVGGIFWFQDFRSKILKKVFDEMKQPPSSITTLHVQKERWPVELKAIGTFTSVQGVTVSSEEAGKVIKINFESGQEVRKGDLLAQQDVSVEESQLKSIQSQLSLAQIQFKRIENLAQNQAATQSELDDADSKLKQSQAQLDSLKSTISRKTLVAPFTGRLGIRQVQLGQYLSPGTPIASLQALNPIYLEFGIPQNEIAKVKVGQTIQAEIDAFANESFSGIITAIQPEVDINTRNLRIQATFKNPEEKLRPGMFATVRIQLNDFFEGIVVPQTAIQYAPYGDSVYVVQTLQDPSGKSYTGVVQKFVKLGANKGDWVAILDGLKEGEEVATTGGFKLRPSGEVKVNNQNPIDLSKTPKPENQ